MLDAFEEIEPPGFFFLEVPNRVEILTNSLFMGSTGMGLPKIGVRVSDCGRLEELLFIEIEESSVARERFC